MRKTTTKHFFISLCFLVMAMGLFFVPQVVEATVYTTHNIATKPISNSVTGFWCEATLPYMNPAYTSGSLNKINFEFWADVLPTNTCFIEMGYHKGYGWFSNGDPDPNSWYNGCFTGYQYDGDFIIDVYPAKGWNSGQTHTMGYLQYTTNNLYYADMRADGSILTSYQGAGSRMGTIDTGLELSSDNGGNQTVTFPCSFTNLNIRNNNTWELWSANNDIRFTNTNSAAQATYNSSTNTVIISQ